MITRDCTADYPYQIPGWEKIELMHIRHTFIGKCVPFACVVLTRLLLRSIKGILLSKALTCMKFFLYKKAILSSLAILKPSSNRSL